MGFIFGSSVGVAADSVTHFNELKLHKTSKYIIYKLSSDNRSIEVLKKSQDADYETFLSDLPENDCRYAVYDFEFDTADGRRNKICFFTWSPDGAPVKSKMVYSSSKDALRRALPGIQVEIQGTDFDEVAYETVLLKCNKGQQTLRT
ncbi:Cofilin [Dactylellina cionopaga]|nr:Cofilin [Dactylellina cionopaga]